MSHRTNSPVTTPVVKGVTYFLAHVPSMIRHGSKPSREIPKDTSLLPRVLSHLHPFEAAVGYPPNQVYIGNLDPDDLHNVEKPWYQNPIQDASRQGPFGEIMPEEEFYGVMKLCDEFDILLLETSFLEEVISQLGAHPLFTSEELSKLQNKGVPLDRIEGAINEGEAMPCYVGGDRLAGGCQRGHEEDPNLVPEVLMENLAYKL